MEQEQGAVVRVLGPLEVGDADGAVALGGLRQRAVLAVLALRANQVVPVDRLVDEVWSGEPPPSAVGTLQRYLSHLRQALEGLPLAIERRPPGYVLVTEPDAIDALRVARLVDEGTAQLAAGDPVQALGRFDDALAAFRGPPLVDFAYEPFAATEIVRLEELRLVCLERRFEAALAAGRGRQVLPDLERAVADNPLREAMRGLLMKALHAAGRRAEALRVYTEGRAELADVGLDPSIELQRLEQAILAQDPALAAPEDTAAGNLPAPVDAFVGRDAECAVVLSLLDRSRLVTLTGSGGTGKTRLALHAAARRAPVHVGGAWLIDLAPVRDGELVARAMASSLGVRVDADVAPLDAVIASLRTRDALLVIDNCEHVASSVADACARLLATCAHVRVLATSRRPLDVAGEVPWTVPPLTDDDARELFADRAALAAPGFTLDDGNRPAVEEICRRLDGIPLAIELATARLRVLTVADIAARLDDRFRLLGASSDDRRRTLRATVEWSHEQLTSDERVLFRRLSVFAGRFGLDDVAALADEDMDEIDVLAGLVDKSLVVRVDGGGTAAYRLLETLRHFGAERLVESGEARLAAERHAAHFLTQAEAATPRLRGADAERALDELEQHHDDHRAALRHLVECGDDIAAQRLVGALWPFWDYRSHVREGRAWTRRALARRGEPTSRLRALIADVNLAYLDDDAEAGRRAVEEGLAIATAVGDDLAAAQLLVVRSEIARMLESDVDAAELHAQAALARATTVGDPWWEAQAMRVLTLLAWDRWDLLGAEVLAARCLDRWERCGDVERVAGVNAMLAGLARDRGELALAEELFERSLDGFRRAGEPAGAAFAVRNLGAVALRRGDARRAFELATEAREQYAQLGNERRGQAESTQLMGDAALELGDATLAAQLCQDALERFRARGFAPDVTVALQSVARVALAQGDLDRAAMLCEESLADFRLRGTRRHAAPALLLLAEIADRRGNATEAASLRATAADVAGRRGRVIDLVSP